MIVRQARGADAQAVCDILNPIIRHSTITFTSTEWSVEAATADIHARGAAFQVAEQRGDVAGFATYAPFRSGPGYARTCEVSIHLTPLARGRGVGRLLMERLQEVAIRQGIHVLVAGISSSNPAAMGFHAALGFEKTGYLPEVGFKDDTYLDLIFMQKILAPGPDGAPDTAGPAR